MVIQELLRYAIENNDFYRSFYKNNLKSKEIVFEEVPIVEKKHFQQYGDVLSYPYFKYPLSNNLLVIRSSGSTGQYLKIFWDKNDRIASLLSAWRWRTKHFGVIPREKMIDFFATQYINNRFIDLKKKRIKVDSRHLSLCKLGLDEVQIDDYIEEIKGFSPAWMILQPSILLLLSKRLDECNDVFPPSLKYIELTGEYINYRTQLYLSQKHNVTISNFYGCNEVNYIACECSNGNMHILEDNVYVQIIKNGKECAEGIEGSIVVTGLWNKAMPIIKYDTGDIGSLIKTHNCNCGSCSPILKLRAARKRHKIKTLNNEYSSSEIVYLVERTNELLNNCIFQYQVIQKSIFEMDVLLVLKDRYSGWKNAVSNIFLESIQTDDLRNLKWNFYYPEQIYTDDSTGKVSYFKSLID